MLWFLIALPVFIGIWRNPATPAYAWIWLGAVGASFTGWPVSLACLWVASMLAALFMPARRYG